MAATNLLASRRFLNSSFLSLASFTAAIGAVSATRFKAVATQLALTNAIMFDEGNHLVPAVNVNCALRWRERGSVQVS
jgi:hypothetical protein